MSILSIDFGGTRTRAAWFSPQLEMLARHETLSRVDRSIAEVIDTLIQTARAVVPADQTPAVIGICAPGPLDPLAGVIKRAETLPGWQDVHLARLISSAFNDAPTFVQNDGNLGALAEHRFGSLLGADPAIFMTISTGIGGGAILNGKLFSGSGGLAIEPGHLRIAHMDGKLCRLEELASGTALGVWAQRKLAESDQTSSLRSLSVVDGKAVGAAAQKGDPLALQVVAQAGYWLGVGIANLLHVFNPQGIALGGSVTRLGDLLLEPTRRAIRNNLIDAALYHDDLIRYAALGENACLQGAALYAFGCLNGDYDNAGG